MFDALMLARAITAEARHPIWGELFQHVIVGHLTGEDVELAISIERPCPDWVKAVAGGNLNLLPAVAEVAFDDFLATWMMEQEDLEEIVDALSSNLMAASNLGNFTGLN
jgi:hypothetical protein